MSIGLCHGHFDRREELDRKTFKAYQCNWCGRVLLYICEEPMQGPHSRVASTVENHGSTFWGIESEHTRLC